MGYTPSRMSDCATAAATATAQRLLTVEEARRAVLEPFAPTGPERVPLSRALGRTLAGPVVAADAAQGGVGDIRQPGAAGGVEISLHRTLYEYGHCAGEDAGEDAQVPQDRQKGGVRGDPP